MLLHIFVFLNLCAAKDFEKNYLGTSNIALFTSNSICSENHLYLERTDFGKKIDKKDRKFR